VTHPDFILIGAQKAGTTALYHYLRQHPEVYMPEVKEPGFFAFEGEELDYRNAAGDPASICSYTITDPEEYKRLFDGVGKETAVGEATTLYLHSEKAVSRIRTHVPDAKIIAVLRHPVDRAYSAYMHAIRKGQEPIDDFETALEAEARRIQDGWGFLWRYETLSRYAAPVRRYLEAFGREQVRVYLFEDFVEAPSALVQDVYDFIGCDPGFEPDTDVRYNASGTPKRQWVEWFLGRPHTVKEVIKPLIPESLRKRTAIWLRNQNLEKPKLSQHARQRLAHRFEDDIRELQTLLDRDLCHWLPD
jgi:hypothetical protein